VKMFDADKTRMIRLPYGEKNYDSILSCFHPIPERHGRTNRQTDGRTDRIPISHVSMLTREKNIMLQLCKLIVTLEHHVLLLIAGVVWYVRRCR